MNMLSLSRLALVTGVASLAACASSPPRNPALDEARASYQQAAADPDVLRSAPTELRKAQEALAMADTALKNGERAEVNHFAYLAKKRTEIAMEARAMARSEEAAREATQRRDAIVLESRTRDAETQRRMAEVARLDAEQQRRQAETARDAAMANAAAAQSAKAQADAARADANSLAQELADLKAKPTERGMVLTLGDVLFDTGRANLNAGASGPIDHLATFLNKNPERTATIEGYTDSSGGDQMNQALSERRAESVKNALVDRGVEANRIASRGLGESQPVATNDTAAGRQQNRRVEIILSD